jgi:hypothetical protein
MSKTPKRGSDDAATGKMSSGNTGIECAPEFDCQRPTVTVIAFILKKPRSLRRREPWWPRQ